MPEDEAVTRVEEVVRVPVWREASIYLTAFTVEIDAFLTLMVLSFFASERFGASPIMVGLILGGYSYFRIVGVLFWGSLSDRIGRKPPMIVGSIVVAASIGLLILAGNPWEIFIIQIARGFFGAAPTPVMHAMVADLTPRRILGERMGLYVLAVALAPSFGIAGGLLLYDMAWWIPFALAGMFELITIVIVLVAVPETLPKGAGHRRRRARGSLSSEYLAGRPKNKWIDLFTRRGLMIANYWEFVIHFLHRSVISTAVPLFAIALGFSATDVGILAAFAGLTRTLTYVPMGAFSDRHGRRFGMVGDLLIKGVTVACYPLFPFFWAFAGIRIVEGWSGGLSGGPSRAIVMDWADPELRGRAQGINECFQSIGTSLGPLVLGIIIETAGFDAAFYYAAVITFVSGLIMFFVWKKPPRHEGE